MGDQYLIINEDGHIFKTNQPTEDDYSACDDGLLSIIDTYNMSEYYNGEWHPIQSFR